MRRHTELLQVCFFPLLSLPNPFEIQRPYDRFIIKVNRFGVRNGNDQIMLFYIGLLVIHINGRYNTGV